MQAAWTIQRYGATSEQFLWLCFYGDGFKLKDFHHHNTKDRVFAQYICLKSLCGVVFFK